MKCGVFFSKIIVACAALLSFHSAAWATSISLSGNYTYQYSGSYVVMSADKISNNTSGGYSGTLRMELWAFSTPYTGASQTGYKLATYQLPQQLNGGQYYSNVSSGSVAATYPPSGTWYISLLIGEYTTSGWTTATYGNFSNVMTCSGGYCTTGTTPTTTTITSTQKDCLFNWAENNYPALFSPSRPASGNYGNYYYRYYSSPSGYLAVSSSDNHFYYYGSLTSWTWLDLGLVSTWLSQTGCQ